MGFKEYHTHKPTTRRCSIAPSNETLDPSRPFRPPAYFQDDEVTRDYADFFAELDFSHLPSQTPGGPGRPPHPLEAYVKAFLVKVREKQTYYTDLRRFLLRHPSLVLFLGFCPKVSEQSPFGFDLNRTVPTDRHLRRKLQELPNELLQPLLEDTVKALKEEVPHFGQRVALDNKHIYAFVKQNNKKTYVKDRYDPACQPKGDPDCRLGVKKTTNQDKGKSSEKTEKEKEYVWGYGTSVVVTKHRDLGEFVVAEHTEPFDVSDVAFFPILMPQVEQRLGFRPKHFTADAAYDAWYVYDYFAQVGGTAYVPINLRGHPLPRLGSNGCHQCEDNREMIGYSIYFDRTRGYRAQQEICPILYGNLPASQTCRINHPQFQKGKGCVKHQNLELGARIRIEMDRSSREFKRAYAWRTCDERIFSQAKELGIERPRLRNLNSIRNQNTLTYVVINVHALKRVREAKQQQNKKL